jgi:hypothetical protein
MSKRVTKKENNKKIKGFTIRFMPYSEIKDVDSDKRIKKILNILLGNNILILQGKLKPEEEARLIGDTMVMVGHVKNFKGIELAIISNENNHGIFGKIKKGIINTLAGSEVGVITILGPATIVKEIKKDPKKIELLIR